MSSKQRNERPMRILFLGEMMPIGSCSYRIRRTEARKLAQQGREVTLITPHHKTGWFPREAEREGGLRVLYSPGVAPVALRRGGFSFLDMLYKLWMVIKLDFDVLHVTCGHRPAQLIPALAARFLKGRPTVDEWWEWYGDGGRADLRGGIKARLIGAYDRFFELPAKSVYSAVIAISSKLKDRLCKRKHLYVLHGGVEVDHLQPGDKQQARELLGLSRDSFVIGLVSVGRSDHPDLTPFLAAFRKLAANHAQLRLFITGEEGYIREEFFSQQGGGQIIYKGWLEMEKYSLYLRACDVFVLPISNVPRNAGRWPHKIGDFLYFERPIISNPTGDLVELFADKKIGFLCDNEPDAYCERINHLIKDINHLNNLCTDSREVAANLSSAIRVRSIMDIYQCLREENR